MAIASLSPAAVAAGSNTFENVVKTRIIPGWTRPDGSTIAGIEVTLSPGWKTYWRAPGDGGVPPIFNWEGSQNLGRVQITWPAPDIFNQNGMRTLGYSDRVIFPLTIAPRRDGKPIKLAGSVEIGICREVCIPIKIKMPKVAVGRGMTPDPSIVAALAARPFSAREAGVKNVSCTISPTKDGLKLTARFTLPSTGGRELAVVETGDPNIWASEPRMAREGSALVAKFDMAHASGGSFALNRSALRFTILGKNHAVDIKGCVN